MIYAPQLRYMDEIAPGLSPEFRSSSINAQYHMISTSTGIGVLPCFIGDSSKELVRILPDDVEITRNFWMVIHRDVRHLARVRSEEHTSELQSLMRISYAVFCLKKKIN